MIRITDKSLCCGCTACMNACPAQCIVMRRDREGFDYPVANPDLCRNCGKCTEICPMPDIKAHVHEESLSQEQSMKVIEEGGVIYAPSQALLFGLDFNGMLTWIAAGFPFDVIHGISNFFCGILICPIIRILRVAEKYAQNN